MTKVIKRDPITQEKTEFWQKEFCLKHDIKKFRYRYIKSDTSKEMEIWEREPHRKLDLTSLNNTFPKENLTNEYQTFQRKDCIRFQRKHNEFIKVDVNFIADFVYNKINENIFIGILKFDYGYGEGFS